MRCCWLSICDGAGRRKTRNRRVGRLFEKPRELTADRGGTFGVGGIGRLFEARSDGADLLQPIARAGTLHVVADRADGRKVSRFERGADRGYIRAAACQIAGQNRRKTVSSRSPL